MAYITKRVELGKRGYEYELDIEACVEGFRYSGEYGNSPEHFEVGEFDIQVMRNGKVLKGRRAAVIEARFYKEYDTDEIDQLLIEAR